MDIFIGEEVRAERPEAPTARLVWEGKAYSGGDRFVVRKATHMDMNCSQLFTKTAANIEPIEPGRRIVCDVSVFCFARPQLLPHIV